MNKILYFTSILFLGFAHPAKAIEVHGWTSLGIGISILDGRAAETAMNCPSATCAYNSGNFESDPALAFNVDVGVAIMDVFRFGAYLADSTVFKKDAPSISSGATLPLRAFTLLSLGGFTGVQFELGSGTATRHYLYADYGFGWQTQTGGVLGFEGYNRSSLNHMVRVGADVPDLFRGMGAGLELMWTFPQTSPRTQSFSVLAKTSYRF